jgi:hypothetical protein
VVTAIAHESRKPRPRVLTALALFFFAGGIISFTTAISLAWPGGPLDPIWRLNPRARTAFASMGSWSIVLMLVVSAACTCSALGIWRGARWGRFLAIGVLTVNLIGDAANAVLGDARAAIGVPVAALLAAYLARSSSVREFFSDVGDGADSRT